MLPLPFRVIAVELLRWASHYQILPTDLFIKENIAQFDAVILQTPAFAQEVKILSLEHQE